VIKQINIGVSGQGLHEITNQIANAVAESKVNSGLCTLFIRHTSASLLIQENADRSARKDLENWLARLVPENDLLYTHVTEGADDMPAHIRSMLTQTSLSIPISRARLLLGSWQGIFLFEHRHGRRSREIALHILSDPGK
jgi:secondary thiamine-phosphate synthase enzyme